MIKKLLIFLLLLTISNKLFSQEDGLNTLRNFDKFPLLRTDVISAQQSSHDPTGFNSDGFSSGNFPGTYNNENVMLHLKGKGIINRIWLTGYLPGDKIKIYFDGETTASVDETLTTFFTNSTTPFLNPWVLHESQSSGGYISYLPFPFEESILITTTGNHFYNINYQLYTTDNSEITTWTGNEDLSVETEIINNKGTNPHGEQTYETASNTFNLASGQTETVFELNESNKTISAFYLTIPEMEFSKIGENVITDNGHATTGYSEFKMKIEPNASKVILTRRFDSWVANQKANVYIDGALAGEWFEDVKDPIYQWRNANFEIPTSFTSGKSEITIKIEFVSSDLDWNEFHYWIYCDEVLTDEIDVANSTSEAEHNYVVNPKNWSGSLCSQYPVSLTDKGRAYTGYSSFNMKITPDASEYKLIRRCDFGIGNQKAKVYVNGTEAGIWDNEGVNVHSRWADKEFVIPSNLVAEEKTSIQIKLEFVSSDIDWNDFHFWLLSDGKCTDELNVNNTQSESSHNYQISGETWAGEANFTYGNERYKPEIPVQNINLQVFYDGETKPSIDAPLGLFFATSTIENTRFQSLPVGVLPESNTFYSYFPMPFQNSVKIKLVNNSLQSFTGMEAEIKYTDFEGSFAENGYLKTFHKHSFSELGKDHLLLDVNGTGKLVGTVLEVKKAAGNLWLEGDERFYIDGSRTPQFYGTGTEDYFNGGWYFNRGPFDKPFHGYTAMSGVDRCLYRFHITDPVYFNKKAFFGIEHGPSNDFNADYRSLAFYYHKPQETLTLTDELNIGNGESMNSHNYSITGGFETQTAKKYKFEGDLDDQSITRSGNYIKGSSEFQVNIHPEKAVRIKRFFDYALADQSADVYVDDVFAGTWFTKGSNTSKRWREEFFNIPSALTLGKSNITLRFEASTENFNWSEFNYQIFALDNATSTKVNENKFHENEIKLFPNPVSDYLFIKSKTGKFDKISVYNLHGQLIFTRKNSYNQIKVSDLENGVYFLEIKNNKKLYKQKFIKN